MAYTKLRQLQDIVVNQLSTDSELSTITWLAENRRDLDFEIKKALGEQGIVGIIHTPRATYNGANEDNSISWQIDQLEVDVIENVPVNRHQQNVDDPTTSQDACMRIFDVLCPLSGDNEGQFLPIEYEEGEDNSLLVGKCTLRTYII